MCICIWASLVAQLVKTAMQKTLRSPGEWIVYPLQYSCLENPRGQRSLGGYSPWGRKELDTTEQLSTYACVCAHACTHTHTHTAKVIDLDKLPQWVISFKNAGAIDRVACKNLRFKISLTALWVARKLSLCCHLLQWFFPTSSKEQGCKYGSWLTQGGYLLESCLKTHHRCWHLGQGE